MDVMPLIRQPPLGGCVLKQTKDLGYGDIEIIEQPPLGGCVLKQTTLWKRKQK